MIKIVSRKEIFENYSLIKDYIGEFQLTELNENENNEYYVEWLKENLEYFDLIREEIHCRNSRFFKLDIKNHDLKTFTKEFSKSLLELFKQTETEEIILISEYYQDIFGWKEHPYYKVKKSYKNLIEIVGNNPLKEALVFGVKDFPKIFECFFWLERCDPSIPEFIFWFDSKERYCFTLCKHGNIHVTEFTYRKTLKDNILKNIGFRKFYNNCEEKFSKTGAIKGRQLNPKDFE